MLSLFFTGFSTQAGYVILSLLLIEIGATFKLPVGVTGQLTTVASILTILFALLTGVLTLRYGSRSLLLVGLAFYALSAVGCYLAPVFIVMLAAFSMNGLATAMVYPMLGTIIGDNLPAEERPKALGLITAGQPITLVVGTPIISVIATQYGWRMTFLLFMLPVVIINILLIYIATPKKSAIASMPQTDNLGGYRGILASRPALACLFGATMFQASMYTSWMFIVSYLRETFMVTRSVASLLIPLLGLLTAAGSITVGKIIKRYGSKRTVTYLSILLGVFVALVYVAGFWWLAVLLSLPWSYVAGGGFVSGDTLTLDQVPEYRGTLMSLNTVARNLGIMLGTVVGGMVIILFGYHSFGLLMGVTGVIAATIYHTLTSEPTKTE